MSGEIPGVGAEEMTFSRTFFGYDPLEVRAFVKEANDRIAKLAGHSPTAPGGNGAEPRSDVRGSVATAAQEIGEVLESARSAAQHIRGSAEADVSDSVESARREARRIVAEAEGEAFTLRQVAWEAATEMLESAGSERAAMRAEAERNALRIIHDAEHRAMRSLTAARRESENALRTARAEYERLVEAAGTEIDQVDADRSGEGHSADPAESVATGAPTGRLVVEVPAGKEQDTEAPSMKVAGQYAGIRVIPAGSEPAEGAVTHETPASSGNGSDREGKVSRPDMGLGWADGTRSVRLVGSEARPARVEVDAVEIAREVALIRATASATGDGSANGIPSGGGDPDGARRPSDPVGPVRAVNRSVPEGEAALPAGNSESDELAVLFSRLRRGAAHGSSGSG